MSEHIFGNPENQARLRELEAEILELENENEALKTQASRLENEDTSQSS